MAEQFLFHSLERFTVQAHRPKPPATRFQGSKLKLLPWLDPILAKCEFETALDAFGGSGAVSYLLKSCGKTVTFNDQLHAAATSATALIENSTERLSDEDVALLLQRQRGKSYDNFIERTFSDIYYTDEENAWLDRVAQNIPLLSTRYKSAIAYHALFQAALAKRPYNLFHRRNLYLRFAEVDRTFGNKTTWDRSFETHFRAFVSEANDAIFDSGKACKALQGDVANLAGDYDLVYLDPPYVNSKGAGTDYFGFYHFLEGLRLYETWPGRIDYRSKHRRLLAQPSNWLSGKQITASLRAVVNQFRRSTIVLSYRSDGVPNPETLFAILKECKSKVTVHRHAKPYKYALSTNSASTELLFVATG